MTYSDRQLDRQFHSVTAQANATNLLPMVVYLRDLFARNGPHLEHFHAIFLDQQRGYINDITLGSGGRAEVSLRMRSLFAYALQLDARVLVVAHNHPSGHCQPSARDIVSTKQIEHFARAVDIKLLDHLIVTPHRAYSMRAGGHL